ncbi:helix-turn-helix domain-containing protein [Hyalangium rubrum]|uniref:Helix-turn-helix domain-containing protein n=1 Tax=Hyalangium rubrum TaxID=3103134 RepID=A0ABU5HIH8_9BACT|nr:helix-turn-helix domain-containing protein [Hyalangium sp. s54d21]MDY7233273.1 helix-turn-helix domain-containing protein [Hyalangium sp. s54d21]
MKPFEQQTYYELLEIPVTAPDAEIIAAYERALETYSPDSVAVYALVDPAQIDALRARLTEAMEILTEPDLRAEYDRMIGVNRAEPNTVVSPAPSLVERAPAVEPAAPAVAVTPAPPPSAPEAPESVVLTLPTAQTLVEAPAPVEAAPAPAPAVEKVEPPSPPPAAPAPTAASAEAVAAPSTPSVPTPAATEPTAPAPVAPVGPAVVSPTQVHAAFRSYALSYVPVLIPGTSQTGSAFLSPFNAEAVPPPPAAAPTPEAVAVQAPAPAAEPAPAPVVAEAPRDTTPSAPAPAPVEPAAAPPAPVPAPAVAASKPAHEDDEELSGARAPLPAQAAPRPTPRAERPLRPTPTPPPLPPGGRRLHRPAPTPPPVGATAEASKGNTRAAHATGLNLEEAQQIAQESAIATAESAMAVVAAKAREPKPKPIELPPNTEFNGELLRRVRESRNLTLQQLAERTRISSKHIENVEADRYAALPATVYLRGMLMNVARELGLDPLRVSKSYLALATAPQKK